MSERQAVKYVLFDDFTAVGFIQSSLPSAGKRAAGFPLRGELSGL